MRNSLYVDKMIERTTQNTIDDCICMIEIISCLIVFWFFLVIMC